MATSTIHVSTIDVEGVAHEAQVTARIVDTNGDPVPGAHTVDGVVVRPKIADTVNGVLDLVLVDNADIIPANTGYHVSLSGDPGWCALIHVDGDADLVDAVVESLPELDPWVEWLDAYIAESVEANFAADDASERLALAATPDAILFGDLSDRDANGALLSSPVLWPDGTTGAFTALLVSVDFPGAIDSYSVTYAAVAGTITYTQPAMTRDAVSGVVTARPDIEVS